MFEVVCSNLLLTTKGKHMSYASSHCPQVFQTFKWMLKSEQQNMVSTWVKRAVAATFSGKEPALVAECTGAANRCSSDSKAKKAKQEADSACVMHLFGN